MKILNTKKTLRNFIKGKSIGFIPTMGALHEGHVALIKKSLQENPYTLVSIFVNPKQFGPREDYASYPRDLKKDKKILTDLHVDALFCPNEKEMYQDENKENKKIWAKTYLGNDQLENLYCGKYRPGFFNGVLLVVIKLFHLIEPTRAYFGKKDYQQYFLIKEMVKDLDMKVNIKGVMTVRNSQGLAISSRNQYLTQNQLKVAENIHRGLRLAKQKARRGDVSSTEGLKKMFIEWLKKGKTLKIQYVEVVDRRSLLPTTKLEGIIILTAVYINRVRLIDNIEI